MDRERRRILFLVNKHSARGSAEIGAAVEHLRCNGFDVELEQTTQPADIPDLVRDRAHRTDILVVGGGDGTLNAVADVATDVGMPLGIVPMGTANDLARTLRIPEDPVEACRIVCGGHTTRVDLGWVNGKHFFNVASLGASVEIARAMQRRRDRNARWGLLSYPIAMVESAAACSAFTAHVRVDDHTQTLRSLQISVGNGRHYGGGMTVAEEAAIDDQALDLYSLKDRPAWQVALHLPALRSGRHAWDGILHLRGKEIFIETEVPMSINTDGELTTETPAHFKVLPCALEVFVPPPEQARKAEEPAMESDRMMRSDAQVALDEVLVRLKSTTQHYGDSAEIAQDGEFTAVLRSLAEQRAVLAGELEGQILEMGDYPDSPDDDYELVGQVARRFKAVFSSDQREALLRERLGDDEELASAISKALQEDVPPQVRQWLRDAQKTVAAQIDQVRALHDRVVAESRE